MSNSLRPHGLQHARIPCPSPNPGAAQTHVHRVGGTNRFVLCRPLLFLPSIFPSIRDFYNESVLCIRWPKDWSFSFNISPSNEYLGLISFRIGWLDLLAVQGTLKSSPTPWSKSINSLVLNCLYSPTLTSIHDYWKTISLTRWTFVGKVMTLLFNMLSSKKWKLLSHVQLFVTPWTA